MKTTTHKPFTDGREVYLPRPTREDADIGVAGRCYRRTYVDRDGTVFAWDGVGLYFTRHHGLSASEQELARQLVQRERER